MKKDDTVLSTREKRSHSYETVFLSFICVIFYGVKYSPGLVNNTAV